MEVSYRERPSKKTSIASNTGISRAGEEEEKKRGDQQENRNTKDRRIELRRRQL